MRLTSNRDLARKLEYELLSGEDQKSKYWKRIDKNIYEIYFEPVSNLDFVVYTPIKVTNEDNKYKLELRQDEIDDFELSSEYDFTIQSAYPKFYLLRRMVENRENMSFISCNFKDNLYNCMIKEYN